MEALGRKVSSPYVDGNHDQLMSMVMETVKMCDLLRGQTAALFELKRHGLGKQTFLRILVSPFLLFSDQGH